MDLDTILSYPQGMTSEHQGESMDTPCSMADHIATRKSTFTSASASRKRRTHQPSVRDFGRRVSVNTKPDKSRLMAKQKQAEECVLYVRGRILQRDPHHNDGEGVI